MSIVTQTLQDAIQRRWKLALGVLLVGALLAVCVHAFDLTAVLEEVQGAAEQVSEADPDDIPTDQLGQMARGAGLVFIVGILAFLFTLGVVVLGFFMPQGLFATADDEGATLLSRYGGVQLATLVLMAILGLTAAARFFTGETPFLSGFAAIVHICLLGAAACAISFAFATFGIRHAAWLGLGYYVLSWLMSGLAGVLGELADIDAVGAVFQFVIFPAGVFRDFIRGLGPGAWDWGATGMVAYHFALWTAIALLGLRRLARSPDTESHDSY
ncbi:MAG: hypothetical protein F4059_03480 [Gemmatimonadetes bacterium]|nr:hypothetical protein [Gemmatimonadota bacterium]